MKKLILLAITGNIFFADAQDGITNAGSLQIHPGDYTRFAWKIAGEHDTDHFIAERSDDGRHFYGIAPLSERDTGNVGGYSTRDSVMINNMAYYRLKYVDKAGAVKSSGMVRIKVNAVSNQLVLLQNPVHDQLVLVAGNQLKGIFNYHIITANGQSIQQGQLTIENNGQYQLPLKENCTNGTYILRISNNSAWFRHRFIRQ